MQHGENGQPNNAPKNKTIPNNKNFVIDLGITIFLNEYVGIVLINNIENKATRFERIIAGIMCYVLYHGRNRPVTKIHYMNSEFTKIITASADASTYFKQNVTRFIDFKVDPFK